MKDIVVSWLISFFLGNLEQYETTVDWNAVKTDADKAVNDWIPAWADVDIDQAVNDGIVGIQAAFTDEADLKQLLTDAANQNWQACLTDLESVLSKAAAAAGVTLTQKKLLAAVRTLLADSKDAKQ